MAMCVDPDYYHLICNVGRNLNNSNIVASIYNRSLNSSHVAL